jgi:hypothetical protein
MAQKRDIKPRKGMASTPFVWSADDWRLWKNHIEQVAKKSEIWGYCNPEIERAELPCLKEPEEPTIRSVQSLKDSLVDLSLADFTNLHSLASKYKAELATYQKKKHALEDLSNLISESISSEYRSLLQDVYGQPHEQLKILSGMFDHPPRKTLKKLQSDWSTLQNLGALPAVRNYVRLWQSLYQQCVDWNLVLPQGRRTVISGRERSLNPWSLLMSRPRRIGISSPFSLGLTVLSSPRSLMKERTKGARQNDTGA